MRFAVCAALFACVAQSQQLPRFSSSREVVRLDVSVTDHRGPVRGLRATDFVVSDNGTRPHIEVQENTDAPLDIVVVAQPVRSVAFASPEQAARIAPAFTTLVHRIQAQDRFAMTLAGVPPRRLRALLPGPPDFGSEVLAEGVEGAPFDAIVAALNDFDDSQRRRVLVAFTPGWDARSTTTLDVLTDVTRRLGPSFVLMSSPIKFQQQVYTKSTMESGAFLADSTVDVSGFVFPSSLKTLARRTGGLVVNLGEGEPGAIVDHVLTWLRTRYVVSYDQPPGTGWHALQVTVPGRKATVTAREGYVAGPPQS